jgi:hypothetical protein
LGQLIQAGPIKSSVGIQWPSGEGSSLGWRGDSLFHFFINRFIALFMLFDYVELPLWIMALGILLCFGRLCMISRDTRKQRETMEKWLERE